MKKKKLRIKFRFLCLIAYIMASLVLIAEASMNGKLSSSQSNAVGGTIADIVNGTAQDQTQVVLPESLIINNKEAFSLTYVGDELKLDTTILPENSTYKEKRYVSLNPDIASVTNDGVVTFLKEGSATLEVINTKNEAIRDSVSVVVANVEATSIKTAIENAQSDKNHYTVYVEDESLYKINTLVYPTNTTIKNATYASSNPEFIKVTPDGKLYDLVNSKGLEITITVTVGNVQSEMKVVVEIKNFVELQNITASVKQSIYVGEKANITVGYVPSNATYKQYKLSTSNKSIVSVSTNSITGVKEGEATIKVESSENSNIYSILNIEVKAKEEISAFDISKTKYELYEKGTATIGISNIKPNQYADKATLTYKSTNESIAKVSTSGKITAVKEGTTTITITAKNGYSKEVTVVVKKQVVVDNHIIGFNVNTTEEKTITLGANKEINLASYYFVEDSAWIYDDSGIKTGTKKVTYVLEESSANTLSSAGVLTVNELGYVTFSLYHSQSGYYSNSIKVLVIDEFSILDENDSAINEVSLLSGTSYSFKVKGLLDENFETQTYTIELYDGNNEKVLTDPIIEIDENGLYNIKSLYRDGNYSVKVIPVINNKSFVEFAKVLNFNVYHNTIETIEVRIEDENGMSLDKEDNTYTMKVKDEAFIKHIISSDVTKYDFTYKSSNTNVLTVVDNKIVAKSAGEATITILEKETNKEIQVSFKVDNIIILNENEPYKVKGTDLKYDAENNTYSMLNGYSGSIKVNFDSSSTYKKVTYSSNNEEVLTVGSDGTLTPHKAGNATITITCDDGIQEPVIITVKMNVRKQDLIKDLSKFFYQVRKGLGHFGAFLVLGICSTFTYMLYMKNKKWLIAVPVNFAAGFALAGLTELIQKYVPGRAGRWADVWIDYCGFLCSAIILTFSILIYFFIKSKKKPKNTK